MILGVMQPYLFPYIGYFQLIKHADVFVFYDDVTYIKGGFINRNYLWSRTGPQRFTLPVFGASSNRLIRDVMFSDDATKLIKTLSSTYASAPNVKSIVELVASSLEGSDRSVPAVCRKAVECVASYLGWSPALRNSSHLEYDRSGSASDRLISMCGLFGASEYVNSIGGSDLYSGDVFASAGIDLTFLRMISTPYNQPGGAFLERLSIIDALMWCSVEHVNELMSQYEVVHTG